MTRQDFRGTVAARLIKHVLLEAHAATSILYQCKPRQPRCAAVRAAVLRLNHSSDPLRWSSKRAHLHCMMCTNFRGKTAVTAKLPEVRLMIHAALGARCYRGTLSGNSRVPEVTAG